MMSKLCMNKPNQNPKIFMGLHEKGDLILLLARGLRELGYQTTSVVGELDSPILQRDTKHGRYIRRTNKLVYLLDLIKEFVYSSTRYDIFVFFGRSFLGDFAKRNLTRKLDCLDLPILKLMGKTIVFVTTGSDIRSPKLLVEQLIRAGLEECAQWVENAYKPKYINVAIQSRVRMIERYAECIFAYRNNAQFLQRSYQMNWMPIDLSKIQCNIHATSAPLVLHAPSNRRIKGTSHVLQAVERLQRENYQFNFILCENMSNKDVRELLAQSEIVLDQFILPGYGLIAVEAMASGNVVLGSAMPTFNKYPKELPIVVTTPSTIYQNLKDLLENPERRLDLANQGRAYVEKYHEYRKVAQDFAEKVMITIGYKTKLGTS